MLMHDRLKRCSQCVRRCDTGLNANACWETTTPRMNGCSNDGVIKRSYGDIHHQYNRIYHFFAESDLIYHNSSFCLQLTTTNLQCNVFFSFANFYYMSVFVWKRHFWLRQYYTFSPGSDVEVFSIHQDGSRQTLQNWLNNFFLIYA